MKPVYTFLLYIMIAAIVIAMSIAMMFGVISIRNLGRNDAEQTIYLLCDSGKKDLDNYFEGVEKSVRDMSDYIESDLMQSEDFRLSVDIDRFEDATAHLITPTDGVLAYYYRVDPEISSKEKGFRFINPDGEGFQKTKLSKKVYTDGDQDSASRWFTVPREIGEAAWITPYISKDLDSPVISYNAPIYKKGHFLGVVGIELDYNAIAEKLGHISIYKKGYAFLLGSEGEIFYHPGMDVTDTKRQPEMPEKLFEDTEYISYSYDNVDKSAVWRPLKNGMRLYVTVPASEINARWQRSVYLILAVTAGLLLAVLLLFAYIHTILQTNRGMEERNSRLEEELQSAADLTELMSSMSTLMTNIPAMSFSKDALTGTYLACNQLFAEYAGKSEPGEVVGLKDYNIFDQATASHFIEADRKALSMDEAYVFFEDVPDANGKGVRNLQTTKRKFLDASGRLCILGLCVDVTETTRAKAQEAADQVRLQEEEEKNILEQHYKEDVERLSYQALHDELTGVYNRAGYDMLMKEIDYPATWLLMIDANKFKQINDSYGHEIGDRILIKIADALRKNFRQDDAICRVGGDEFVVLMGQTRKEQSSMIEAKVCNINRELADTSDGLPATSVSVGYAHGSQLTVPDPVALMKLADQAMYEAKRRG